MGKLSETRATCCPSAYSCPRSGGPWYSDHPCTHTGTGLETWTYTSMSDGWTWHTGTTTAVRDVNAYGISIRWQAVDFASTPFTASASPTSTMTATSSTPSPSSPVSSSSGLSLRTQAGIGVSCAVAFLTLFFVG
ncbi:hypothetical protein BDV28DRAFT_143157 [Aspergillus coremiiformis]|uniref:Uncharacterized protein n=1 Tax=Aspergillus coremiiformis TaxID=138285 RepID=A0A5N6YY37_9EURO|nr:hypothetical protein BDV28DRAFT_143157 [Aspergillus coremiiformis]